MRLEQAAGAVDDGFVDQFAVDSDGSERPVDRDDDAARPVNAGVGLEVHRAERQLSVRAQ
jgi:hypothetical protein